MKARATGADTYSRKQIDDMVHVLKTIGRLTVDEQITDAECRERIGRVLAAVGMRPPVFREASPRPPASTHGSPRRPHTQLLRDLPHGLAIERVLGRGHSNSSNSTNLKKGGPK